jgi:[ribosomal protein S5]-alanine N-acetyltransferase
MELTTDRLILREFIKQDWPAVLAYQNDRLYLRYYHWTGRTAEDVQSFIQRVITRQHEQPRIKFQLAITLKSSGQLIGNCGIRMDRAGATEADIGYELDPQHWGQGYATEAAQALVRFGFTILGVHRIWAACVLENSASAHVMEKLGMKQEGRLREKEYFKDRWWDTLLFAVLEQDWAG